MMRKILIGLGVVVVICIAFFAITFGLAFVATNGVADAANSFMTAVQDKNYDAAYAMLSPALQEEVSADDFNAMFTNMLGDASLESWSFSSRSVENNTGQVSGTATIGGEVFNVALSFVNSDEWKLTGYDFAPQ